MFRNILRYVSIKGGKECVLTGCLGLYLLLGGHLYGEDLKWIEVVPLNDSRDIQMRDHDDRWTKNLIRTINASEEFTKVNFRYAQIPVAALLEERVAFVQFNFDSIYPAEFTETEKKVLEEWFRRGGFLLALEDTYPYEQELFRQKRELPFFNFFVKDLPALDSRFSVLRADDSHPIFQTFYHTETASSIKVEMQDNPNYRGRTMLLYDGKVVAFFMGSYSIFKNGRWNPLQRPFNVAENMELKSYYLILNLYLYAMMQ